jgi:hypothetical protein
MTLHHVVHSRGIIPRLACLPDTWEEIHVQAAPVHRPCVPRATGRAKVRLLPRPVGLDRALHGHPPRSEAPPTRRIFPRVGGERCEVGRILEIERVVADGTWGCAAEVE